MGKKKSRERTENKREKRVRFWMAMTIVFLMVVSSMAFVLVYYSPQSQNTGAPTALDYEIRGNQIFANLEGQEIPFSSFPDTTIYIPEEVPSLMQNAQLLVVLFDPLDEENIQFVDLIRFDMVQYISKPQAPTVLNASELYDFPRASCADASEQAPVIQIINGSQKIDVEGYCITVSGQQLGLLVLRDQLLYSYYGAR